MLAEVRFQCERFTASSALVRFGVGVRLDMRSEVRFVCERFAADAALERFLACMRTDVTLQQPGTGEALIAGRTLAALVVGTYVHRVGRHGDVHLGAVRTSTGFLIFQGAVEEREKS